MGLRDALRNNENTPVVKEQKVFPEKGASVSVIHKKKRRIKEHSIIISIFLLMLVAPSFGITTTHVAYSQAAPNIQNIPAKKVQVGDINIAYKPRKR